MNIEYHIYERKILKIEEQDRTTFTQSHRWGQRQYCMKRKMSVCAAEKEDKKVTTHIIDRNAHKCTLIGLCEAVSWGCCLPPIYSFLLPPQNILIISHNII